MAICVHLRYLRAIRDVAMESVPICVICGLFDAMLPSSIQHPVPSFCAI
jgi:hypothetical protein